MVGLLAEDSRAECGVVSNVTAFMPNSIDGRELGEK
jgi:hypothetical protein